MSSLDLFIVNLAFPYISRDYPGTSLSSLSWVLNAYTIVFAAVLVPAGRWADRIGRRRLFSAGLVLFSFGSVLCGLAPGVAALIAARVIQAAGAGAMVPASLSLLLAAVPAPVRPRALGTWSALGALGAALGPVIGGLLVQANWRWVFWINVPVGLVAVWLAARVVPESKDPNVTRRPDVIGACLLALAVGLVALAQALWLWRIQVAPAYVTHLLPAQMLGGAGVGLAIPSLLGAGSASLAPARFGTGSGILNTGRQVGTVLGVAGLVAILARVSPADPLAAFRGGLVLVIVFFAAAGVVSAVLLTRRPVAVPAPAPAP